MPFLDYMVIKTLFSKNIQWPVRRTQQDPCCTEFQFRTVCVWGENTDWSQVPVVVPGGYVYYFFFSLLCSSLPSSVMYYRQNWTQRQSEASRPAGLRGSWASRCVPLCIPPRTMPASPLPGHPYLLAAQWGAVMRGSPPTPAKILPSSDDFLYFKIRAKNHG